MKAAVASATSPSDLFQNWIWKKERQAPCWFVDIITQRNLKLLSLNARNYRKASRGVKSIKKNVIGLFLSGLRSVAERRPRSEGASKIGGGGAAAGGAEARGHRAKAEGTSERLWRFVSLSKHARPAQLRRTGPAPSAEAALHPEPAALWPRPHRWGKKEQVPTRIRHHVTYTHTLSKAPYSSRRVDVSVPIPRLTGEE